jgi:microcompartment protein CcmK/EutM
MADLTQPDGEPLLAVDTLGAGAGDLVMLTSDAAQIKDMFHSDKSPLRWTTLGIIESTTSR